MKAVGGWILDDGKVVKHNIDNVIQLLEYGFVPVLHGDAVLDTHIGCNILSGDTIIKVCIHCISKINRDRARETEREKETEGQRQTDIQIGRHYSINLDFPCCPCVLLC